MAFLDLRKAYDSVVKIKLSEFLDKKCTNELESEIVTIIKKFYKDTSVSYYGEHVIVNRDVS